MVQALILLLVANGSPVAIKLLLRGVMAWPVDAGHLHTDGRRILGDTKSWRGVVAAVLLTEIVGQMMGFVTGVGALFAALAMVGDLVTSYGKRRAGVAPSAVVPGVDQAAEALLPLLLMHGVLGVSVLEIASITLIFIAIDSLLLKWRDGMVQ